MKIIYIVKESFTKRLVGNNKFQTKKKYYLFDFLKKIMRKLLLYNSFKFRLAMRLFRTAKTKLGRQCGSNVVFHSKGAGRLINNVGLVGYGPRDRIRRVIWTIL